MPGKGDRGQGKGQGKVKEAAYSLVERREDLDGVLSEPYRILYDLIKTHYPDHVEAGVYLEWSNRGKVDDPWPVKAHKVSPRDRPRIEEGVCVLINRAWWDDAGTTYALQRYMLDHALATVQVAVDQEGEPVRDAAGRLDFVKVAPPIQVFPEVEERNDVVASKDVKRLMALWATRRRAQEAPGPRHGVADGPLVGNEDEGDEGDDVTG
jgi:hypothetical protein